MQEGSKHVMPLFLCAMPQVWKEKSFVGKHLAFGFYQEGCTPHTASRASVQSKVF